MSRLAVEQEGPNWEGVDILSDIEDTSAMIETQMGEVYDLDRTGQIQASLLLDNLLTCCRCRRIAKAQTAGLVRASDRLRPYSGSRDAAR